MVKEHNVLTGDVGWSRDSRELCPSLPFQHDGGGFLGPSLRTRAVWRCWQSLLQLELANFSLRGHCLKVLLLFDFLSPSSVLGVQDWFASTLQSSGLY